ncbi:disease resistance protein SUMM2-like [Gastrolobium bilobum]|uniref:disease resistance protein SUMM2-like n=1 Tax=Gastrolobium bilobum TaxID=150636 RepID=UPI002AB0F80F|nr:disease resistance protein SUMM2-like [Gastrolobium bilobum]
MADIPNELAKKGLEKLMDRAIGEARYICCFTSIAADCEKEKGNLEAKVKAVGQHVDQLRRSAQDTPADVTSCQERAGELIQEDTRTKNTCFFGWCPNCIWRYSRGKELANKTEDIRRIMQEIETLNITGLAPHLPGIEYHSSQDYVSFKSRELKYKELLDALTDDNNYIIGLQGMGGSGKTTLALKVGQELKQSKQFDLVIDTTVSSTPAIRKIQDDIAVPLGLASELKDKAESERPKLLQSRLTKGEKILLILDDVWENTVEHINFETIGIPKRGCKVLLTTRHLRACRSLECDKIIELQLLPEDEAWTLFEKHACINNNTSKGLVNMGHEIVKECKGLPVAVAIIASRLKGEQRQEQWNAALISLQKPMYGVSKDLNEIYKYIYFLQLPKLIGICSENYRPTFLPLLTDFTLSECSHFNIKSIGDLSILDSRELGSTTIKDLSGDVQYFLSMENPKVNDSKEISEQQMHLLRFAKLQLGDLSQMTYIFVGPKNSGTLQNLEELAIARCEQLEVIFSASMLRCLPQLLKLMITECKELKHIIEEDKENERCSNFPSGKTCFPKLALLVVNKCNKLKCVFHVSTSKEFPKLESVIIKEAYELEEVFKCEQKIELPNLEIAILVKLPSLCRGIEFQTAKRLFMQKCAKLSLTSTAVTAVTKQSVTK